MANLKIYNAVTNMHIFKKWFPDEDGIVFPVSSKKGRIVCSCGKVSEFDIDVTPNPVCSCGNKKWISLPCQWSENGTLSSLAKGDYSLVVKGTTEFVNIDVLNMTVVDKALMSFEERTMEVANYDIATQKITQATYRSHNFRWTTSPGEYVKLFSFYSDVEEIMNKLSMNKDSLNYWQLGLEILNDPVAKDTYFKYPTLFKACRDGCYGFKVSVARTFEQMCDFRKIPVELRPYWYILISNYHTTATTLTTLLEYKETHEEIGEHLLRLVSRGIIRLEDAASIANDLMSFEVCKGMKDANGTKVLNDRRVSWAFNNFARNNELTEDLIVLSQNFVMANILEFGRSVTDVFMKRVSTLNEHGILPTDDSLSDKEYFFTLNNRSGKGKPKFFENIQDNPLEAVKYWTI